MKESPQPQPQPQGRKSRRITIFQGGIEDARF